MTGTFQSTPATGIKWKEEGNIQLPVVNGSGEDLVNGQEVIMKSDGTLDKRDAGTEFPIGVVAVGGKDGDRVTIHANFSAIIHASAKGAAHNPGAEVVPDGTLTEGRVNYIAATAGDFVSGLVLTDAASTGDAIRVGILPQAYKK